MIAQRAGSPKVHLHADDFWRFIKAGGLAPWQAQAHEQNRTVMNALAGAAARYADGGYFVLVDGIIGPWFLGAFTELPQSLHYIVLRPDLDEAIRRCRARGGDTLTDVGVISALHDQLADLGPLERHALSVAGLSVEATCSLIGSAVESGRYRLNST